MELHGLAMFYGVCGMTELSLASLSKVLGASLSKVLGEVSKNRCISRIASETFCNWSGLD